MQAVNNPRSAPRTPPEMSPRNIAAQQAAARQAAAQRAAQAARMQAVNNPRSAPRTPPEMSPRNIAAQQAAARRAAAANKQAAQSMRSAGIRDLTGTPTGGRKGSNRTSASTAAANQQAAQSLLGAGYRNVKGDKNKSTILQQIMSGFRNTLRGEGLPGDNQLTAKPITTDGPSTRLPPPRPTEEVDPYRGTPEIIDEFPPVMPPVMPPQFPQYPGYGGGMMGGLGAFGYNPALMQFESQQGAGQVPYYMAAARNAQTPNMSPAFMHAARNYDILGGMQRTAPRPMEMMSAAERAQIAGMSNFNTPNYNSPYDQFNFFSNMVGGGGGKGMGRPAPQMAGGLAPFMMGMFG